MLNNKLNIKVEDDRILKAIKVGDVKTKFLTNFEETEITLKDVLLLKK